MFETLLGVFALFNAYYPFCKFFLHFFLSIAYLEQHVEILFSLMWLFLFHVNLGRKKMISKVIEKFLESYKIASSRILSSVYSKQHGLTPYIKNWF